MRAAAEPFQGDSHGRRLLPCSLGPCRNVPLLEASWALESFKRALHTAQYLHACTHACRLGMHACMPTTFRTSHPLTQAGPHGGSMQRRQPRWQRTDVSQDIPSHTPVVRWDPAGLKVWASPRTSDDAEWQLPSAGSIGGGLRQQQIGASGDGSGSNRKNGTRMPPPGRRRRRLALALVAAAATWLLLTGIYMGSLLHAPVRIHVEPPHACSDVAA